MLELSGHAGAEIVAAIPGGRFEIFFALWLIIRGFSSTSTSTAAIAAARV